jgi:AcrR family transcriptional regulator
LTKNKILDAGEYLFASKGYYKTSSRDIAERSGVSIGSFYAYFRDKKGVLLETLERHNIAVLSRIKKYLGIREPGALNQKSYIINLINAVVGAHGILPEYHREIVFLMHTDHDIEKMMKKYLDQSIQATHETLTRFRNILKVKDLRTAAEIITVFIEEIVHHVVFNGNTVNKAKIIKETAVMIGNYLLKRS